MFKRSLGIAAAFTAMIIGSAAQAQSREIGSINYSWRLIGSSDAIKVNAVADPKIKGVVCYWSAPQIGGISGAVGLATDPSDASLACRQVGEITITEKFGPKEDMATASRSFAFKTMHVVRMCDAQTNTLVYLVYSDRLIDGSPKNAISAVPIMPWGSNSKPMNCSDFVK